MSDSNINVRDLQSRLESEENHIWMLEETFSRIRFVTAGDKSDAAKLSEIRTIAHGVPGSPDFRKVS